MKSSSAVWFTVLSLVLQLIFPEFNYLADDRGAELGRDGLEQHSLHLRVHVDDLRVAAPNTALAHVALQQQ
jgi:hypothetical protein